MKVMGNVLETQGRRNHWHRACLLGLLAVCLLPDVLCAEDGRTVLKPLGEIRTPGAPFGQFWSGDSKFLAVTQSPGGFMAIAELASMTVQKTVMPGTGFDTANAWSPDGKYFAHRTGIIKIYETEGWTIVSEKTITNDQCGFVSDSDIAFTADSKFLWIGCARPNLPSKFITAVKISIPDIEIVDRIQFDAPENA